MTNKELTENLKHLRVLRAGGEPNPEWVRAGRDILMMQVRNTNAPRSPFRIRPHHFWQLVEMFVGAPAVRYVLRPVTVLGAMFVLVFGGWITSVNASLQSVPGDTLYNLKIATEKAQIAFAGAGETKVKLQLDFAGRRVEEVARILETPSERKAERLGVAVAELKKGVTTAQESLKQLQSSDPEKVPDVIKALDRKVAEYHISLDKTVSASEESAVQEKVAEAKKLVADLGVLPAGGDGSSSSTAPAPDLPGPATNTPIDVLLPQAPQKNSGSSTYRIAPPSRSDRMPVVR